jgi:hypothetical protein
MSRSYSRDDVETHYGQNRPAVNVKVYDSLADGFRAFQGYEPDADSAFTLEWIEENVSDESLDSLFWRVCADEVEQAVTDAREILGVRAQDVEQDGRSGGWLVVTGLPDLEDWDAVQIAKWRKFERYAKSLAGDVMYQVVSSVYLNDFEWQKAEKAERERAANQDVSTVGRS